MAPTSLQLFHLSAILLLPSALARAFTRPQPAIARLGEAQVCLIRLACPFLQVEVDGATRFPPAEPIARVSLPAAWEVIHNPLEEQVVPSSPQPVL